MAQQTPQQAFEFVVGNRPEQLNGTASSRLRSHLSRRSWQAHLASAPSSTPSPAAAAGSSAAAGSAGESGAGEGGAAGLGQTRRRRRRRARPCAVTYECVGTGPPPAATAGDDDDGRAPGIATVQMLGDGTGAGQTMVVCMLQRRAGEPDAVLPPIDYRLGGGRVDPFRSYPGPWRPYIPALTDHYIIHMAVDSPQLDQPGNAGLLRSRWYPLVLSDPSPFAVIMLLSAANYVVNFMPRGAAPDSSGASADDDLDFSSGSRRSRSPADLARRLRQQMLGLKQTAITAINAALRDPRRRLSDEVVGAVAKMASFEAMQGDEAAYRVHMEGLCRMLDMRGGIASLGLDGLLRRMVVWIDLNSAFLLGVKRYFPGHNFTGQVSVPGVGPAEPDPAARILPVRCC